MKRTLCFVIRLILGITFIISGILKGFDPIGLTYKIEEFFIFFSLHDWVVYSRIFAAIICSFELAVGILLVLGIICFWVGRIVVIIMLLFTIFTLFLLINPNVLSDCGCFGDAMHLTPGESFAKNVLLLLLSLIYVKVIHKKEFCHSNKIKYFLLLFAIVVYSISIPLYSFCRLPVIDFLPYEIGAILTDNDDENVEGSKKSHFILFNDSLDVVTTDFISADKTTLFVVVRKPDQLSLRKIKFLKSFINIQNDSLSIVFLVTTSSSELRRLLSPHISGDFEILQTDDVILKSFLRCDNGFILVRKGIVRGKWNILELSGNYVMPIEQLEDRLSIIKYLYVSYILLFFLMFVFIRIKFF